jgi:hypothetical protein
MNGGRPVPTGAGRDTAGRTGVPPAPPVAILTTWHRAGDVRALLT